MTAHRQTMHTYARMVTDAGYRPAAPSDGMGNITAPCEQLDLATEADAYATAWHADEDSLTYSIGCPDYEDRPALILAVEAARQLCGGDRASSARLLRLALADLEVSR